MAYETALGKSIIPLIDILSLSADANTSYPNGIGKKKGMMVYMDNGGDLQLYIAQGSAANADWTNTDGASALTPV